MTETSRGNRFVVASLFFLAALAAWWLQNSAAAQDSKPGPQVFELRTYTAQEGKFDALKTRFRDHTVRLFKKHGMTQIGYWTPTEEPKSKNTLIYLLAFPNAEAREKSWAAFRADPEWRKALEESEKANGGKLTERTEFVILTPTDFSPMQ